MTFKWLTEDGKWHERTIWDTEERIKFIEWLETDKSVIRWR